jgi:membrane-associated phospholipid phosphatase
MSEGLPGEQRLLQWAHRHAAESRLGPRLHQLDTAVPYASAALVYCLLGWVALQWPESRAAALRAMAAGLVAWIASDIVKLLVARPRPCLTQFVCGSHSFPEGPGMVLVALAVAIWPTSRAITLVAAGCAVADATVQVAYGSHWPSDLLGAWLMGGLCGVLVPRLALRLMRTGE